MSTTFTLSAERQQALIEQLTEETGWGGLVLFLDTVDSVAEMKAMEPLFRQHAKTEDLELPNRYIRDLSRWPHPVLTTEFRQQFPLVSARLDTTWKIRVFFRAVSSRDVTAETMAQVFEELIYRHEVQGEKFLWYPRYRGDDFCTALRIVYHTELPYWTLTRLMFHLDQPKNRGHRIGPGDSTGLFIDWRTEAEQKAAGDYK